MAIVERDIFVYPGSPKTKLCRPLVAGNPVHESSQRPFFVWSWTSSVYVYYFGYPLPSNTQQQNTCLGSGLHTFATFAGFRDVSQYFAWFFQISGPQKEGFVFQLSFFSYKQVQLLGLFFSTFTGYQHDSYIAVRKSSNMTMQPKIFIHFKEMPLWTLVFQTKKTG